MAIATTTALGIAAVVASVAGSAVAYTSAQSAARTNDAIALANAQAATAAANREGQANAAQAQLQAIQYGKEQEAALANAKAIRDQTEAETRAAQENIRRGREDFQRALSAQRAAVAARGVVATTGSPLELLVKAAGDQQLLEEESRYADEISRRAGYRSADLEEVRAAGAGIDQGLSLLSAAAARNNAGIAKSQAKLNLFSERVNSTAMRNNAAAGLLSSVGSMSRDYYQYRKTAPLNKPKTTAAIA